MTGQKPLPLPKKYLVEECKYYEENRDEFARQYPGEFLVIYGRNLIGHHDSQFKALEEGTKKIGSRPFLVRQAGEDTPVFQSFFLGMA